MDKKKLKDYARLLALKGVNVEKGDEVWVFAGLDQPEFITMVVEELYKGGAKYVEVFFDHDPIYRLDVKYQTLTTMATVSPIRIARLKYRLKKNVSTLYIDSSDPDALEGVNQDKIAKARMKSYPKIKKYIDAMEGKYKWCIGAIPGKKWAKKIFPDCSEEEAVEKLWDAIFTTSRVDGIDAAGNWDKHNANLIEKRNKLHDLDLVELHYSASNGTDFTVGLIAGMLWGAGVEETQNNHKSFNPNIPSEEVFTTPMRGKAEGLLVASKPLSYMGEMIENFSVRFKDGKVCEVKAEKGQKLLETMVKMDEGASMLGEVALIPDQSPINETGILFYNTLFDENAACHVALGAGFRECYPDSADLTTDELKERGVNDSMIHVDFMIGTKDLNIVGTNSKGEKIQIFKDGDWAI